MSTLATILPLFLLTGIIAVIVILLWKKQPHETYSLVSASRGEVILLALLGFFLPFVGLILFLVWRNTRPELAAPIVTGLKVYFVIWLVCLAFVLISNIVLSHLS